MRSAPSIPSRWLLVIIPLTAAFLFFAPASSADPVKTYCPISWVITDQWTHPHLYFKGVTVPDQSAPWAKWWQYYQDVRDPKKVSSKEPTWLVMKVLRDHGVIDQIIDSATLCYLQKAGGFSYSQALTLVEAFGIVNEGNR